MKKIKDYKDLFVFIILFFTLSFITIGYATFYKSLNISGSLNIRPVGKVYISKIERDESKTKQLAASVLSVSDDGKITIDYSTTINNTEATYESTYLIHVKNDSIYDYTYTGFSLNPDIKSSSTNGGADISYTFDTTNSNNTLNVGELVKVGEEKVVALTLQIHVGSRGRTTITIGGGGDVNTQLDNTGELYGSISTTNLDLRGETTTQCFNANVINTYNYQRSFTLKSSNENFSLVDSSGNPISSFTIAPPSETDANSNNKTYEVCLQKNTGAIFTTDEEITNIIIESSGLTDSSIGQINIKVDISDEADDDIPEVSIKDFQIISFDVDTTVLTVDASWQRLDSGGTSIINYYIQLYDETSGSEVPIATYQTNSDITNYAITFDSTYLNDSTNLQNMVTNDHKYYVRVYGEDKQGNIGSSYCTGDSNNFCAKSSSISLKWKFNVIDNITGASLATANGTTAYVKNTFETIIVADSGYNLPSTLTVNMGDNPLQSNQFEYGATDGSFKTKVSTTGDIKITGTGSTGTVPCFVKGTKILLWNGTEKNIENIEYDDLIKVWSYDLGRVVYEYPNWIDKDKKMNNYQRTTFSDGTVIETVGNHSIFNVDLNKYVSVLDRNEFNIGTNVYKINEDDKLYSVSVTNIETINEEVTYYHVESTMYFNVFGNKFLTSDPLIVHNNMYPFYEGLKWGNERGEFLKTKDFFHYKDWYWLFPSHMFYGMRMWEMKFLWNIGLMDIPLYAKTLTEKYYHVRKNKNNQNIWKITTSDDLENGSMGIDVVEGRYYELKKPISVKGKKFIGWYNTSDNKLYPVSSEIQVKYGMYFEAVWE